jgi:hypothetical protein
MWFDVVSQKDLDLAQSPVVARALFVSHIFDMFAPHLHTVKWIILNHLILQAHMTRCYRMYHMLFMLNSYCNAQVRL